MLDRDVLRDPATAEDGEEGAERVAEGRSECYEPDVLYDAGLSDLANEHWHESRRT